MFLLDGLFLVLSGGPFDFCLGSQIFSSVCF